LVACQSKNKFKNLTVGIIRTHLQCETAAFAIKENVVVYYRIVADFPENRMYENNFKSLDFKARKLEA